MKIYRLSESVIAYHGSANKFNDFSIEFVGKGDDREGPGIYFTSHKENAEHFKTKQGQIVTARLHLNKVLKTSGKINYDEVEKMIAMSFGIDNLNEVDKISEEQFHDSQLVDWGEDINLALFMALKNLRKRSVGPIDAFQNVWIDFYRNNPVKFVQNMTTIGYDGLFVDRHSPLYSNPNVRHYIIYNKNCIEILGIE